MAQHDVDASGMSALLQAVTVAVKQVAAEEILPRYLKVSHQTKEDGSLCTEADIAAQASLCKKLQAILYVPVLGEEMTTAERQTLWQSGDDGLWCVDPIDGTFNFVRGLPYFAVSVALLRQGESVLGVVYDPIADEMFAAEFGKGCWLNGERLIGRNTVVNLNQALVCVDLKRLNKTLAAEVAAHRPFASQRNLGASTLDWCYVAAGRFDLYLHGAQKLWDYSAGALILAEAGGQMHCIEQDDFSQGDIWRRSVIAGRNVQLLDQWKHWVRQYC